MAKIFMSMSGEGRGHATRTRSIVERIRDHHEITLFAPGDAYQFLSVDYSESEDVRLVEIPGMKFHYVNRRLNLVKTIAEGLRYKFFLVKKITRQLKKEIEEHQPDFILTDFEPGLPRAAKQVGLPFFSLTHQHFLLAYDLSHLPFRLRFFANLIGIAVRMHYTGQKKTLISSFFKGTLLPSWKENTISVGPMIRPEVRGRAISQGDYLLSYLRKNTPDSILELLSRSPLPIKVYGLGKQTPFGSLTFHEIDPIKFVDDMANCRGVVSAAGNQLLGECMYLGKPVLAIPETWHHEQLINAYFLREMACGHFVELEQFSFSDLEYFLDHLEEYRTQIEKTCQGNEGTEQVIAFLEQVIQSNEPVMKREESLSHT